MFRRKDTLFGVIDHPRDNQVIPSPLKVSGWVLSRSHDPHEIHLEINGKPIQARIQRIPRLDVFRVHPQFASYNPLPGFTTEIVIDHLSSGDHTLACIATEGEKAILIAQTRFQVVESEGFEGTEDLSEGDQILGLKALNPELAGILTKPNRVLLMHIPKTAGTTLNDYLSAQFPKTRAVLHAENIILGKTEAEIKGLESKHFISAHLKLDTLQKYINLRRYFTITIFRDPTQQTLSHLAWVKRLGAPDHHKELAKLPDNIKRIVERINTLDLVDFFDTLTREEKNLFDNCQTRYLLPFHGDVDLTESYMQAALLKLNTFDAIGLTERFDDSIVLLAYYMGWRPPQKRRALNVSDRKHFIDLETADDAIVERFDRITRFDNWLYANAATIFERQIRNMLVVLRTDYPEWANQIDPEASSLKHLNLVDLLERRAR
jgi:hypothetical protein